MVRRRHKGLLDGTWAHPADQVQVAACLVVGSASARAAEGLLAHHGTRRLIVDVEVARAVA